MGTDILKKAMIETGIMTEEEMDKVAVFPNTAVDRMVFDGHHHGKDGIEVGDAFELPVEKNKLEDPESEPVKGAEYVASLSLHSSIVYFFSSSHNLKSTNSRLKFCA